MAASTYGWIVSSFMAYLHIVSLYDMLTDHLFLFITLNGSDTMLIGRLEMLLTLNIIFLF